jgi:hypothetical protein
MSPPQSPLPIQDVNIHKAIGIGGTIVYFLNRRGGSCIGFPQAPEYPIRTVSNFFKNAFPEVLLKYASNLPKGMCGKKV